MPTIPVSASTFKTLHDIPGTTSLESIVIKQSGDIRMTSVSSNMLYQVSHNNSYPPFAVATIPNASSLLGIPELEKDVFHVIGSQISGVTALRDLTVSGESTRVALALTLMVPS